MIIGCGSPGPRAWILVLWIHVFQDLSMLISPGFGYIYFAVKDRRKFR
jgi:hypothetical protein